MVTFQIRFEPRRFRRWKKLREGHLAEDIVPGISDEFLHAAVVNDHDVALIDAHDPVHGAFDQIALEGDGLEELLAGFGLLPLQEQGDL
jgi:hypothetical protein